MRRPAMASMLDVLVLIDEATLKTNLVRATGLAPLGVRLINHAFFGRRHTQTLIAGRGCDGLLASWVLDGR